jgi:hypothetical protein
MANDTPYGLLLESVLHAQADAIVEDLGRRQRLVPVSAPGGGKDLVLELPPFGVAALRIQGTGVKIEPVGPYLPAGRDLDALRERLSSRLEKMAKGETGAVPRDGGFEEIARGRVNPVTEVRQSSRSTVSASRAVPAGWSIDGDTGSGAEIDTKNPHKGRACLRLDARGSGASVLSVGFRPPARVAFEVQAALRADRGKTPVKMWVEGESSGQPFRRSVDAVAGPEWTEVRLAVTDLPAGGLDRVRVRFERSSQGSLWVDDVIVSGDAPSDATRRAHLVLTAALHAYRERRYADFARLAGSHWAREAEEELDPAERPVGLRSAGTPTDLPSGRRLR